MSKLKGTAFDEMRHAAAFLVMKPFDINQSYMSSVNPTVYMHMNSVAFQ